MKFQSISFFDKTLHKFSLEFFANSLRPYSSVLIPIKFAALYEKMWVHFPHLLLNLLKAAINASLDKSVVNSKWQAFCNKANENTRVNFIYFTFLSVRALHHEIYNKINTYTIKYKILRTFSGGKFHISFWWAIGIALKRITKLWTNFLQVLHPFKSQNFYLTRNTNPWEPTSKYFYETLLQLIWLIYDL